MSNDSRLIAMETSSPKIARARDSALAERHATNIMAQPVAGPPIGRQSETCYDCWNHAAGPSLRTQPPIQSCAACVLRSMHCAANGWSVRCCSAPAPGVMRARTPITT